MLVGVFVCALVGAVVAAPAGAADRVYWGNVVGDPLSFAELDGSAGGDLPITGTTLSGPFGVALDPAAGRIYWANYAGNRISLANLNGSGGADLNTTGATVNEPIGVAIDAAAGRIYWANLTTSKISFAKLDDSGGGDLTTTGATVADPAGVALDSAAGRIYWANYAGNRISFAKLDGSGGGDLNTTGATVAQPMGVALDRATGRIYWASFGGDKISFADLNGGGGADLNTIGATVNDPIGVALDPAAGRIYWGNHAGNKVSFANLNGSGGSDIATLAATLDGAAFPTLLERPSGVGAPTITGAATVGSTLSCSTGGWGADLTGAHLYRAPRSFAFQWSRDGTDIGGATSNSITAGSSGSYTCRVTAMNAAGSAPQTSAPRVVSSTAPPGRAAFGARTLVTLKLADARISAKGPLVVRVANANPFQVTGALSGQTVNRVSVASRKRIKLKAMALSLGPQATKRVKLTLPRALRPLLRRGLKLRLTASLRDPAGNTRKVSKAVTVKLKRRR